MKEEEVERQDRHDRGEGRCRRAGQRGRGTDQDDEYGHNERGGVHLLAERCQHGRHGEWPKRGDTPARCHLDVVAHCSEG